MTTENKLDNQTSTNEARIVYVAEADRTPVELSQLVDPINLTRNHVYALCAGKPVQVDYIQTEIGVSSQQITSALHANIGEENRWYTKIPPHKVRDLINNGRYDQSLIRSGDRCSYYRPYGTSFIVLRANRGIDWVSLDVFPSETFFENRGQAILSDLITQTIAKRVTTLSRSVGFQVPFDPKSIVDETIDGVMKPFKTTLPEKVVNSLHTKALDMLTSEVPTLIPSIGKTGFHIIQTGTICWAISSSGDKNLADITISAVRSEARNIA